MIREIMKSRVMEEMVEQSPKEMRDTQGKVDRRCTTKRTPRKGERGDESEGCNLENQNYRKRNTKIIYQINRFKIN
jgi:hypothetical protein